MPLVKGKSSAAFKKNVEEEIAAGKPQKQAVAIAYAEKAKAAGVKHLAEGGVTDDDDDPTADIKRELEEDAAKRAAAKAALDPVTTPPGDTTGPAKREVVRPGASFLGHELIAPEYAEPTADDLLPASPAEPAATDATQPATASDPGAVDLSSLDAAEARLKAANTANADLSSLAPAEAAASSAATDEGKTIAEGGKASAEIAGEEADALAKADAATKAKEDAWQKTYQPLYEAFQSSKIDPNAQWKSMGFGGKALSIIGAAIGAFATGYSRGAIPNFAQHILDNAVEQNVAAQRANISKNGNALEFMRQHHLDETQIDQLSRLSMREAFAAKAEGVKAANLSNEAQARLETLKADNALKSAEIKHSMSGAAGIANAQADYALAAEKVRLGAAAAKTPPAKPADIDKVNKSVMGLQALDQLSKLVAAGSQASMLGSKIGAPGVRLAGAIPASATDQAMKFRTQAAMVIAAAFNPDQTRQPTAEALARVEAMLPSPMMTEDQNKVAYHQLFGTLLNEKRKHYAAAYGVMPDDTDPYQLAPPPVGQVLVVSPKGERGHIPAAQLPQWLAHGYKQVGR